MSDNLPGASPVDHPVGRLPTVARLYYTGYGSRRYKRASVRNGPGEALTFTSLAEERIRQAVALERERLEAALRQTWQMVDPLNPAGAPGSYARAHYQGMVDALNTLRANLKTPNAEVTGAAGLPDGSG